MATPRIFVSSTCYDLQEIRFQLRGYIQDYGYEAVLSEFDDIFFDYGKHVQDSCLDEIPKCQLFILIIGNNYGSFYHKENPRNKVPDSVTLQEFKRALNHKINKHLFINKYVDYDYNNYKRALNKFISDYFKINDVEDNEIEKKSNSLRDEFNNKYHFAFESYKFVFPFLDIVYELNEGNARNTFESFTDIKMSLKKQWAGLVYEALTARRSASETQVHNLETKIDNLEKNINKLINSKTSADNGNITFNVDALIKDIQTDELEKLQEKVHEIVDNICNFLTFSDYDGRPYLNQRFYFIERPDLKFTGEWLNSLSKVVKNFKWSKFVTIESLFDRDQVKLLEKREADIPYTSILELAKIYNSLSEEDKNSFAHTISSMLMKNYEGDTSTSMHYDDDDLPF